MKKALLLLTAITFLASCSGHFSISKRRYNKGFYIASAHKNAPKPQQNSEKKAQPVPANASVESMIVKDDSNVAIATESSSPAKTEHTINKFERIATITKTVIGAKNKITPINHSLSTSIDLPKAKTIAKSHHQNKIAETNTLLLVILAILVPCLAVYLKDDSLSKLFWITLILQVIVVTWIIAMVLAILHILGKL
jgi:uncharacterized membrane protein YqaE (UPF0057 family)